VITFTDSDLPNYRHGGYEQQTMERGSLRWQRIFDEPFIAPMEDSCAPDAITTPDILILNGMVHIFVGAVSQSQERIILLPLPPDRWKPSAPLSFPSETSVVLEPGPQSFDSQHVFDPAVVAQDEKLYLFYSAIGTGPDQIGAAISDDGIHFTKLPAPILVGRSPEVVIQDNLFSLFFVRDRPGQGYAIYLAQSKDCIQYELVRNEPVLTAGQHGEWDDFEVTTPRIIQINDCYYMIYAGLNRSDQKDIPRAFGLARSLDLINWEKYPHNPVFSCAEQGAWDDGAIWFGTPFQMHDTLYLLYEGGRLENILDHSPALTQVGLADLPVQDFLAGILSW